MVYVRSVLDQDVIFDLPFNKKLLIKGRNHCPLQTATDTDVSEGDWEIILKKCSDMHIFKNKLIYATNRKPVSQSEMSEIKGKGDAFGVEKLVVNKKNK